MCTNIICTCNVLTTYFRKGTFDALYYTVKEVSAQPMVVVGCWPSQVLAQPLFRLFTTKSGRVALKQVQITVIRVISHLLRLL